MASFTSSARRLLGRAIASINSAPTGRARDDAPSRPTAPTRTRPAPEGTRIEYSPHIDGDPDPGEVVWTWVPYEDDPSQGKDRPVVIIGRTGDDLAGVPLTSKGHHRTDEVAVGTGSWDRSGRPSFAKVDQLFVIEADSVRREGAVLSRKRFDDVVAGVAKYHHLTHPDGGAA